MFAKIKYSLIRREVKAIFSNRESGEYGFLLTYINMYISL
jgi:hypothetical protein